MFKSAIDRFCWAVRCPRMIEIRQDVHATTIERVGELAEHQCLPKPDRELGAGNQRSNCTAPARLVHESIRRIKCHIFVANLSPPIPQDRDRMFPTDPLRDHCCRHSGRRGKESAYISGSTTSTSEPAGVCSYFGSVLLFNADLTCSLPTQAFARSL